MTGRRALYAALAVVGLAIAVALGYVLGRPNETAAPTEASGSATNELAEVQAEDAPDQIKNLPPAEQLSRAFQAAFGSKGAVTLRAGEYQELTRFAPGRLVWAPFGPVLLSEGTVVDPSHVSSGKLAVAYLEPKGGGFGVKRKFVPAIESGSMGAMAEWSVSSNVSDYPVVYVEGGGTWQGYTCARATLLELAPSKPIELVDIPVYYSDGGAILDDAKPTELEGKIVTVIKNRSFDVVYTGSRRFTDNYARRGDKYVRLSGRSAMEEC